MKSYRYRYQFGHSAVMVGLTGIIMDAQWETLLVFNIIVAVFLAFEVSHNLYMLIGIPLSITKDKVIKRYWFFHRELSIQEDTSFSFHELFGLSFGKEILVIHSGTRKMRILDNYKIPVSEIPTLFLFNEPNEEKE